MVLDTLNKEQRSKQQQTRKSGQECFIFNLPPAMVPAMVLASGPASVWNSWSSALNPPPTELDLPIALLVPMAVFAERCVQTYSRLNRQPPSTKIKQKTNLKLNLMLFTRCVRGFSHASSWDQKLSEGKAHGSLRDGEADMPTSNRRWQNAGHSGSFGNISQVPKHHLTIQKVKRFIFFSNALPVWG